MYPVVASGHSLWSNELVRDLTDEEFRHEYMMDQVRSFIAFQIRALREQPGRRWSQGDLAKKSGKTQSVISRMEDPDYGKLSLQSLLEIAIAYDLPLLVQFVEWDDWLARMSNLSPSALRKRSFDASGLSKPITQSEAQPIPTKTIGLPATAGNQVVPYGLMGSTISTMVDLNAAPMVGYTANAGMNSLLTAAQVTARSTNSGSDLQNTSSNFGDVNPTTLRGIQEQPQPAYAQ
ncbi:Helix-turn-helix [Bradyrhizobium erythrophlei]|nr:Helix-turn-helix [Bradyrhizobium erythrophlei]